MASTICRPLYLRCAGAHRHPYGRADFADRPRRHSAISSKRRPAALIRRCATSCASRRARPCRHRGAGGAIEALAVRSRPRRHSARSAFASAASPIRPTSSAFLSDSLPLLEGLDVWIIDALRYRRIPRISASTRRWLRSSAMRPRRAILTNLHTDLDYETLRGACRRMSRRPMTGCASTTSAADRGRRPVARRTPPRPTC